MRRLQSRKHFQEAEAKLVPELEALDTEVATATGAGA